jgi:hypothetical protein
MSDTTATPPARTSRGRTILAVTLGVLAIIGLFLSTVAVWARSTVLDGDLVADSVVDALDEPEVADAAAAYITELVMQTVDVDQVVADIVPDQLQRLVPAIVGGIESATNQAALRLLQRPETLDLVHEAVLRAHTAFVQLLRGDGLVDGISVSDGEVTVNLLPLLSRVLLAVQDRGLFDDKDIPELTRDGDPNEQIAQLESAFDRDLPDNFGQLVVYSSDRLADAEQSIARAQNTIAAAKRFLVALMLLTVVLLVATVFVAKNRRKALIVLGLSGVGVMILTRVVLNRILAKSPDLVVKPGARALVKTLVDDFGHGLFRLTALVLIAAALVAFFAFLTGPSPTAERMRSGAGGAGTGLLGTAQRHPDGSAIVSFGLGVGLLWLFGLTWWSLLLAGALAVVGVWFLLEKQRHGEPSSP